MKNRFLFIFSLLFPFVIAAQDVVVNSYFNAADPRDEWIEILVVTDNTDMRNWTIRDNNSSQTAWQTAITFRNISYWAHLRGGTIIKLWNRVIASDGVTSHISDTDPADGYIEITVQDAAFFSGGTFGTSPTWSGASLNFAASGDVIHLRDASGTHVHAIGHKSSTGTDWNNLPSPKLNLTASLSSGDALSVCPGSALADYGSTAPLSGSTFLEKNTTVTPGLPNSCSSGSQNSLFWIQARTPLMTSQATTPASTTGGTPGSITFSWTGATDPWDPDSTTGYMVVRETSSSFTLPSNGTTYSPGSSLGTGTVLTNISFSGTTTWTDNTPVNGTVYYYRVYAYRYGTDDLNGNSYDPARGRTYNVTDFVEVTMNGPLPVSLVSFSGDCLKNNVILSWSTMTETNNNRFIIERSTDGLNYEIIGNVNGNGNSSATINYEFSDEDPSSVSYYRLSQEDFNGTAKTLGTIAVTCTESETKFFPNPASEYIVILNSGGKEITSIKISDLSGKILLHKNDPSGNESFRLNIEEISEGIYFIEINYPSGSEKHRFIKLR